MANCECHNQMASPIIQAGNRPALSRHHDAIKGKGRWEIGIQTFGMTLDELGVPGWKTPNPNCKMRDSQPWDGMGYHSKRQSYVNCG